MNCLNSSPVFSNKDKTHVAQHEAALPAFSVVVCTRDRPLSLKTCVFSVLEQDPLPLEIIVVDDGCLSEKDCQTLETACRQADVQWVYFQKDKPGLPASRNLAARRARGAIVQFLDDDVTLEPGFLAQIMRIFADDKHVAILGAEGILTEPKRGTLGTQVFDWVYRLAGWWALRPKNLSRPPAPVFLFQRKDLELTCNMVGADMAFRREVLLENLFDEHLEGYALGEDRDLAYRLYPKGWLIRCLSARAVHHQDHADRKDPRGFGCMIVCNYWRIMQRSGRTAFGDRLIIGYSLSVVALSLLVFSMIRPHRYWLEFVGMAQGGWEMLNHTIHQWFHPS
jgi:GT2 family glycosyltransferase